ncbi:TPA: integrase domain-containing protein [Legionella pneumophila]|nr:integrase domain-containing protein [Legionella pneumophila]HDI4380922.1 integrase domain-containing protein [Legionella pneumophila]HDI4384403.1 integrase domain-containing protein [Legionella pneumophila]HDI4387315.1 integrase domain-containing protein [Legionella pneumophila]HDI4399859.1 integrase domain-containing protein [Legionella pneumophila]
MSKSKLKSALFSINECIKDLTIYSHASKADTRHILNRCIKDLHDQGFMVAHVKGLKSKHIYVLVEYWKKQGKNPATIKNYMSKLRKLSIWLNKPELIKRSNDHYQIDKRNYLPTHNKAIFSVDFSKCAEPMIRLSLEAQYLFGLRREESMKLVISEAWRGERLILKSSWTKGGIGRAIDITSNEQKEWLEKAITQVPHGQSLIPKEKTYKQYLRKYQTETEKLGLKNCHGLRHAYAQKRYHEITYQLSPDKQPYMCPIEGGKPSKYLSRSEKTIDLEARGIISRELGHSRLSITKSYCG